MMPKDKLRQLTGDERLLEAYSIDDLADAIDIRKTTAGDYLEESEENPYDGD